MACYSPTLDMVVINSVNGFYYRTRLGAWTFVSTPFNPAKGVCWCPLLQVFVAYTGSTPQLGTSPDGVTWTQRTSAGLASAGLIVWSPVANQMLVSPTSANIPYLSDI
jgi:hypothetical protein